MKKPLIIYHDNCADGFGAAFAAWTVLGDEAEYLPCKYGTDYSLSENTFEFKGRDLYILDFSFPKDIMNMLFDGANKVVWLDHHKTAFETWRMPIDKVARTEDFTTDLNGPDTIDCFKHFVKLDNNKSGAYLAWEYFHPGEPVPLFICHIDDYDRWQFKIKDTKEFNKALWSYAPWTFEQWSYMFLNNPYPIDLKGMYNEGYAILRAHNQNVQGVVKAAARECEILTPEFSGLPICMMGLAANCPAHLTSDVGHELATKSGTFGLCWTLGKKEMIANCSLRSNGDYDVSAIAKAFGGGGHRNAAGFEVPIETLLSWLN